MISIKCKSRITAGLLWLGLAAAVFIFSFHRVMDEYELPLLDLRYKLRPPVKMHDKIAFIEISEDSIQKLGAWPVDRAYYGALVEILRIAGARQVIFDIFLSEAREGDADFAGKIKKAGNVYLPDVFHLKSGHRYGIPEADRYEAKLAGAFRESTEKIGHINIVPDVDGKYRRIPPFVKYEGKLYPQMSFLAACDYLGVPIDSVGIEPSGFVKVGDTRVPLDLASSIIVNFPGRWRDSFRHYSFVEVLSSASSWVDGGEGAVNLDDFKDMVCFVAVTATAGHDIHTSPYESRYPGVGIHAALLNSMIHRKFIKRASRFANILILIMLLAVTAISAVKAEKKQSLIFMGLVLFAFINISVILFAVFGLWIDLFYPIVVTVFFYLGLTFWRYMAEMRKREVIEKELSIAKDIQLSFLPKEKPKVERLDVEARMVTARQVGGDLYDFIEMPGDRAGVMIGDVAGKGVPAALYMAKAVSLFKTYACEATAGAALSRINDRLSSESTSSLFVTVCYMVFDMEKRVMYYSLGGHSPIVMLRKGEKDARMLTVDEGMPLGLMEGMPFGEGSVKLEAGDIFVLYTDGVTEAMNPKGEMFGEERMTRIVRRYRDADAAGIVSALHEAVSRFEGRDHQHDDITVIAMRVT